VLFGGGVEVYLLVKIDSETKELLLSSRFHLCLEVVQLGVV
jgi:hypothetical protein